MPVAECPQQRLRTEPTSFPAADAAAGVRVHTLRGGFGHHPQHTPVSDDQDSGCSAGAGQGVSVSVCEGETNLYLNYNI